jgi:gliding motility-associated-like protein
LLIMFSQRVPGQCALITDNYSGQVPSSVCAPVNLSMDVRYKFILPVNPSRVQILYVWNDGTGATTLIPAVTHGDTVFTATASHVYPPADECSYTAEAYVVYDGAQCVSSSRQEQTFSAWARDNQNGADIITDPVVAQFCEGEDIVDVRFRDNSTFNCNINVEPDKPNRITRWVQFIYGTTSIGGDRIPNITIRDPLGNVYQMTDAGGNSLPPVSGPIVSIPIPADGPSQISWPISAPAGGLAGDIFEITMRNWNICNPYDRNPFDAIPPADLINGDFSPITTTALIEIITTPPVITNPSLEFCAGSPINLTLSTSGGTVNWFTDSLLTNHIHTGSTFNPAGAPTYIDNTKAGKYSFYVTESIGACASAPSKVSFSIFDTPAPAPDAGPDAVVCSDTYTLKGNTPVIGMGSWSTTAAAVIDNPSDPHSLVHNLAAGPNLFRWTITNGPCVSVDEVIITRDLQPAPAMAGLDQSFCATNSTILHGNNPTNNGQGTWSVVTGNAVFTDDHIPGTTASALSGGINTLAWTIASHYGVCVATSDTMLILRDLTPNPANAGPDRGVCDSAVVSLAALPAGNGGTGTWSVVSGGGILTDIHDFGSLVSNLSFGSNQFHWNVVSQFGICPGSSDNVIITRDQAPAPAFAGLDQDLCSSVTAPLGGNAATVGSGTWSVVTNPSGINPVITPSVNSPNATVQILSGNEGIYQFAWTIINASCRTADTLIVDFGTPVPAANAGPADSVCGLTATLNGNVPGKGVGTWRKISGAGNVSFTPDTHAPVALATIDSGDEGQYIFEWRIASGSCPPSADSTAIFYKPMPGIPAAADVERCGPGSVVLSASPGTNGDVVHWYKNASGGVLLASVSTYTTPVLIADADYWVASYSNVTGCESFRKRVHIDINKVPDTPVAVAIQHCGNASLTVTAVTGNGGNTNRWYDASTGGNLISQSLSCITPFLTASVTYWVSSYNDSTGCESSRVPLPIQIDPVPGDPVTADSGRCGDGYLTLNSSIGINGSMNRWYDSVKGGALLDTALSFSTPYLVHSSVYWVETVNRTSGCKSARVKVNATIYPVPDYPKTGDVTICGPDSVLLVSTPGLNGTINRWYDGITGGNLILQNNDFLTPYLTSTRRYFVSSYNTITHCESSRLDASVVILPLPGPNPVVGPSQVGINQTNVIYSVNYQPGSTYNWTIPAGINVLVSNMNFIIVEFPNLGTYNLSVTETNSIGCPGPPSLKQVVVKDQVILLDIKIIQGNACTGVDLPLSVLPSGGTPSYTFVWGGDIRYLSANGISNPVFNSALPGNYQLTVNVTDINGNHSSDTIRVMVHPNPRVQITIPDTVVCAGNSMSLITDISGGSGNYSRFTWTGETTPLSATDIPDPLFQSVIRGVYHLNFTVEDNNGCKASDSTSVFNDSPYAAFVSDAFPGCSPVKVSFINESADAANFYWDFGDGFTSSAENPVHQFSNETTSVQYYNVKLSAISANSCVHKTNGYITVYPNPELAITTYPDMACAPADILLSSTPGGFSYAWDFGDGISSPGDFSIMHTFDNHTDSDTVYHITLISTSFFSCLDTGYTRITVHPAPVASFSVDPASQMMPDRTVNIINTTPEGNWTYLWHFGDDSTSVMRDPGTHTYGGPDSYLISYTVKGLYCADSTWQSVEILQHPPVAEFKPVQPGCMPLTIQFENSSTYSNSFLWEFGDGAVSNKPDPEYTYYEPGTYKIKLTAWGDGGTDTYSTINAVWVLPKAYFEIAPRIVYVNDQAVHFFNLSDNGEIYVWDFGDGTGSAEMNPTHVYSREGNYTVTLNVWTENECYDLYMQETAVLVEPTGRIVFPNAFRPESPIEENRVFKPGVIDHVDEYHLMIFNRWGELIFESHDKDLGWDGYINDRIAKQDVYVWKVEGKYSNGQTFVQSGDVTLMH